MARKEKRQPQTQRQNGATLPNTSAIRASINDLRTQLKAMAYDFGLDRDKELMPQLEAIESEHPEFETMEEADLDAEGSPDSKDPKFRSLFSRTQAAQLISGLLHDCLVDHPPSSNWLELTDDLLRRLNEHYEAFCKWEPLAAAETNEESVMKRKSVSSQARNRPYHPMAFAIFMLGGEAALPELLGISQRQVTKMLAMPLGRWRCGHVLSIAQAIGAPYDFLTPDMGPVRLIDPQTIKCCRCSESAA